MKNTIKFLLAIFLITVSSCSLDQEFEDSLTTENSLKTETDLINYTNGVYQRLQHFTGFKLGAYTFLLGGDDIYTRNGSNFQIAFSSKQINAFTADVQNFWAKLYQCINGANYLIENLDKTTATQATKDRVRAEMYYLRAFCHFYLVRMWGDVPLKVKASSLSNSLLESRAPVADVYKQIFADLELANLGLPTRTVLPAAQIGRATKGAAQAMLAKAHLTYANYLELNAGQADAPAQYSKAISWSDSVINSKQYTLIPNFNDLFDLNKEAASYQENIFAITFTRDPVVSLSQSLGMDWGQYNLPATMPNVGGLGALKTGQGAFRIQPWLAAKYYTGEYDKDYRSEFGILTQFPNINTAANLSKTTITYPRIRTNTATSTVPNLIPEVVENQPYMGKFMDGLATDGRNAGNDLPIIRYAEIFLIKAEAINELNGPTAEAITMFNTLRARARNANGVRRTTPLDIKIDGLTKASFRQKIFDERGLEFIGEGQRYFDLIRTKSPDESVSMMQYMLETFYPTKLVKGLPTYTAATNSWRVADYEATGIPAWEPATKRLLLFPIPASEIQANPTMKNNPGY
jgi:starch-binding outer membrane protein, SusD/RagB family